MRSMRLRWIGAIALILLVVTAVPIFAEDPKAEETGIAMGDLAPAWTAKKFLNSEELTLAGLRGKFVFIEYFGTG